MNNLILIILFGVFILISCFNLYPESNSISSSSTLLPVMNPAFNIRECIKQIILLEDHIFHPRKRCRDCITKHFLTIEGLAEEAYSLDKKCMYTQDITRLSDTIKQCQQEFKRVNGKDYEKIGQHLREIRKPLMIKYF